MNIRQELLKEHNKKQTLRIAKYIGNDREKFKNLMHLFFTDTYRVVQRSAWVVNYCAMQDTRLITPYLGKMIDYLEKPVHDAVRRNTVRILQFVEIPASLTGKVADTCFRLLASKTEPLAVKVFSMSVLAKICKKEPGLANELKLLIHDQLPFATAGFISRARKVLGELEK